MVETRGGRRFAVVFLFAAFLVLFLGHWIRPMGNAALTAAAPFDAAISAVSSTVGDAVSGVVEGPQLRSQNNQLRRQVELLLQRNIVLQEKAHEYGILSRMLRYDGLNNHMDLLTARLIASDPNNLSNYIIIDKGARDGLRPGMTVVDQGGAFVGSITDVIHNASKVLLMTSPSSSVGAMDQETRASGVVEGQYGGVPQLRFVLTRDTLRPGDFVVTSGQLNLYPRTILLGQVVRVQHKDVSLFQTADIRPAADFHNLELVQVIRNFSPSAPNKLLNSP